MREGVTDPLFCLQHFCINMEGTISHSYGYVHLTSKVAKFDSRDAKWIYWCPLKVYRRHLILRFIEQPTSKMYIDPLYH